MQLFKLAKKLNVTRRRRSWLEFLAEGTPKSEAEPSSRTQSLNWKNIQLPACSYRVREWPVNGRKDMMICRRHYRLE